MEAILPWVVAPAVFSLGWYLLGYTEARAAGLVNLTAGVVALALAIVRTGQMAGFEATSALAALIGIYLVAEGADALWNLGRRSVGLLAGFIGVAAAVFAVVLIVATVTAPGEPALPTRGGDHGTCLGLVGSGRPHSLRSRGTGSTTLQALGRLGLRAQRLDRLGLSGHRAADRPLHRVDAP